jgi:aminopeptidase YwaD
MQEWIAATARGEWGGRRRGARQRAGWATRVLAALLALATLAPVAVRADELPASAPAASAPSAFSGDAAYQHVTHLAETIGSRPTGTEREAEAANYLAGELRRFGYQTEIQPFSIQTYEEHAARVTVQSAPAQAYDTAALLYSAAGDVAGELVDAGLGRESDWAPGALAGRVALVERGEVVFADKVANAATAGAVAIIIFNNDEGPFTGSVRRTSAIPAVVLSRADGLALRERLRQGSVKVGVLVDAEVATRQSRNVVAMRPGTRPGAVVVGGHFDSVSAGPGANDNASGTAVTLELARYYAERAYPYTLYFVAFGAEEIGLLGSRHFVDALSESARHDLRAMINLDMVGVGDQQRLTGSSELVDLARDVADAMALPRYTTGRGSAGGGSDHASFERVGVPVLFIYRGTDPNYHSPRDRAEYVDPASLAIAGQLAIGVLDRLAAETR